MSSEKHIRSYRKVRENMKKGLIIEFAWKFLTISKHLILLPIFLMAWDSKVYGEWVVLTSWATILELANFGISTACNNEMIADLEKDDVKSAVRKFWAGALPVFGIAILIAAIGSVLFWVPSHIHSLIDDVQMSPLEAHRVLILSFILAGGTLCSKVPLGAILAFRGFFPARTWEFAFRLTTIGITIAALLLGARPVALAAILAGVTWGFTAIAMTGLWFLAPAIRYRPPNFLTQLPETWKPLFYPSLGFFLLPGIKVIIFQVPVILLGHFFGGASVTGFTACRTLTLSLQQGVNFVMAPMRRSVTAAAAAKDRQTVGRLMRNLIVFAVAVIACGGLILFLLGDRVIDLWLGKEFVYEPRLFKGLLVSMLLGALTHAIALLPNAINRNLRMTLRNLAWAVFTMGATWFALETGGPIESVVIGLIAFRGGQILLTSLAFRSAWRHITRNSSE